MSNSKCRTCQGNGWIKTVPCYCIWRGVFNACYYKYLRSADDPRWTGKEYRADFEIAARRVLSKAQYRVFHLHFIARYDFRYCLPRVGLDRGQFFHMVYRIQQILGQEFYCSKPYGLYPVDEYFTQRKTAVDCRYTPTTTKSHSPSLERKYAIS